MTKTIKNILRKIWYFLHKKEIITYTQIKVKNNGYLSLFDQHGNMALLCTATGNLCSNRCQFFLDAFHKKQNKYRFDCPALPAILETEHVYDETDGPKTEIR